MRLSLGDIFLKEIKQNKPEPIKSLQSSSDVKETGGTERLRVKKVSSSFFLLLHILYSLGCR